MNNINYLDVTLQGRNKWWHYAIFLSVTILAVLCFTLICFQIFSHLSLSDILKKGVFNKIIKSMSSWERYIISIIVNSFGCICIMVGINKIHHRSFLSTVCPNHKFNLQYYFNTFTVWLIMSLLFKVLPYLPNPDAFTFKLILNPSEWFALLIPAIIFACISAFIKEFIRGYVLQGLGLILRQLILRYVIPLIFISSLLSSVTSAIIDKHQCIQFQCIAYDFIYDFIFSAGLAIFILKKNSLEAVLGIHAAGILAPIFIYFQPFEESSLATPSMFLVNFELQQYPSLMNIAIIFLLIKFILFYFIFFRRSNTLIL